jgi:hypothetical protein
VGPVPSGRAPSPARSPMLGRLRGSGQRDQVGAGEPPVTVLLPRDDRHRCGTRTGQRLSRVVPRRPVPARWSRHGHEPAPVALELVTGLAVDARMSNAAGRPRSDLAGRRQRRQATT